MQNRDPLAGARVVLPKNDPLSPASSEPQGQKSKSKLPGKDEATFASTAPSVTLPPEAPPAALEPPILPPVVAATPMEYEVEKLATVSWGGQYLTLRPGSRISDATHGPGSVEKMRLAGVALREVVPSK